MWVNGCVGEQKIPPQAEYRKAVDKWFSFIKKTCEKHTQVTHNTRSGTSNNSV